MIAQIFGMTFIGVILICLIWTIADAAFPRVDKNSKLIERMNELDRKDREN
tara:strand:+ start:1309 stop:1461 length:153 start_codon:yes stop_codon:yes gene_type:complete